jgi:hypothetical protein
MKLAVNELNFPLFTRMTYYNARFDSYEILKSGQGEKTLWIDWTYK